MGVRSGCFAENALL